MRFLECTLPTLAENLALDEALLLDAEAEGPEVLRLWHWPRPGVVLGAGGRLADEVHEDVCRADGVPIARRSSGGGSVLLGEGCLLYSLVLRFERDPTLGELHASFRFILGRTLAGLAPHASPLALQGISDLALADRKFSGNAQQRKRTHLLHHGTILYSFDVSPVGRYLKLPPRRPEYRRDRDHVDFLTNLPINARILTGVLRDVWQADEPMAAWPAKSVRQLVAERYTLEDWVRRR
ncbi:MAG: lipoate--protein ligase family protein [Planctomycetes bacterium]|nr:lipoate--protein ligase family protein [Planctomycetota bacterium]